MQADGDDAELTQLQRALASVYRVEKLLARRGTLVEYRAAEINPPRPVVLRILPAELNLAPAASRFRELAKVLVSLNHPNVASVHRVGFRAGVPYFIAMKLVEGRTLEDIVTAQGPLQLPLVLAVFRAAVEGIGYAHAHGAVHGALTPGRVLVDKNGLVQVSEMSVARAVEDTAPAGSTPPRIKSPEEAADVAPAPAGDQYGLGLLALAMLTGSLQPGADPQATARDIRLSRVAVPDTLVRVVQAALAPDPAKRFPSAADLLTALKAIPFSEADGREAGVVLGRLARGEPVPRLRPLAPPAGGATTKVQPAAQAPAAVTAVRPAAAARAQPAAPAQPAAARQAPPPSPPLPSPLPHPTVESRGLDIAPVIPEAAPPPPAPPPAAARPQRRTPSSLSWPPADETGEAREDMPPRRSGAAASPVLRTSRARGTSQRISAALGVPEERERSPLVAILVTLLIVAGIGGGAYWWLVLRPKGTGAGAGTAQAPAAAPPPAAPATAAPATPAADTAKRTAAPPAAPGRTGVLMLDATPSRSFIFIDGKQVGRRGKLDSMVAAGSHRLEVMASGYQGWDSTVYVPAGDTLDLGEIPLSQGGAVEAAPQTGTLSFTVVPSSADIFVDGTRVGTGALDQIELAAGDRQIRISADGYATLDTVVTVQAGVLISLGQIILKASSP